MVKIDKNEVLSYLGYKDQVLDEGLQVLIEEVIKEVEVSKYKCLYKRFYITADLHVKGTKLQIKSKSLKKILKYSDEIVIFAVTLGYEMDKKINILKYTSVTEMMIVDACASQLIEKILDQLEVDLKRQTNKYLSHRFSPGYGDFSLTHQKHILNILEAPKQIGLMANDSFVLMPKKSVTGIIGLQTTEASVDYFPCDACLVRGHCDFTTCYKGDLNEI